MPSCVLHVQSALIGPRAAAGSLRQRPVFPATSFTCHSSQESVLVRCGTSAVRVAQTRVHVCLHPRTGTAPACKIVYLLAFFGSRCPAEYFGRPEAWMAKRDFPPTAVRTSSDSPARNFLFRLKKPVDTPNGQ